MMNDSDSGTACMTIQQCAERVADAQINAAQCASEPSVLYRPTLSVDGNQWCALYGKDFVNGVCGFGASPALAMQDFNLNWAKALQHSKTAETKNVIRN